MSPNIPISSTSSRKRVRQVPGAEERREGQPEDANQLSPTTAAPQGASFASPCVHQETDNVDNSTETPEDGREPSPKIQKTPPSKSNEGSEHIGDPRGFLELPTLLKPVAPDLQAFMAPNGTQRYRPRPEWFHSGHPSSREDTSASQLHDQSNTTNETGTTSNFDPRGERVKFARFGKDWDTALIKCIRDNAPEAALKLIEMGVNVHVTNARSVTPLIYAIQKGNIDVSLALLKNGADPSQGDNIGNTPLLQAAHFGQKQLLLILLDWGGPHLIENANLRLTTPLMRASQEGHEDVVRLLLEKGAQVNRVNSEQMSALMLAAQRGHASTIKLLIKFGANLNALITQHRSNALHLACKRSHTEAVRVLVTAGCELWEKDIRGRNARDIARRKGAKEIVDLVDGDVQIRLMQEEARRERSFEMVRIWSLLQAERADIPTFDDEPGVSIHQIGSYLCTSCDHRPSSDAMLPLHWSLSSTQALFRTMDLPAPLLELITEYLPMPNLWAKRLGLLTKSSVVDSKAAVISTLDLIDEILEEGGFLEACDAVRVQPPGDYTSWVAWKADGKTRRRNRSRSSHGMRVNVTTAEAPGPSYLALIARSSYTYSLGQALTAHPFRMPGTILRELTMISDLESLTRRTEGSDVVNFESSVPMDLVMLASRLCSWFWREREGPRRLDSFGGVVRDSVVNNY